MSPAIPATIGTRAEEGRPNPSPSLLCWLAWRKSCRLGPNSLPQPRRVISRDGRDHERHGHSAQRVAGFQLDSGKRVLWSFGMATYRLRSFGPTGRIVAVQRFSAGDDKEAVVAARDMVKGASGVATFDLWNDGRRIEGAAPTMKGKPSPGKSPA